MNIDFDSQQHNVFCNVKISASCKLLLVKGLATVFTSGRPKEPETNKETGKQLGMESISPSKNM